ncbi:hypothetical protein [Pseudoalteromonas maricaloris]|uniref:hypothetical protein n=1 Tax=Pseudoalteromonas maricaloris TaxID=184924 RepID=UPI00029B0480|nr:hypothetical protein [Pseudoalteromonas flavipulchra]
MSNHNRNLDQIQKDIEFANSYRMEAIKHLMSIAAGIFVFSIAFMKDIIPSGSVAESKWALGWSWCLLLFSLLAGIALMKLWDKFYASYRKSNEEGLKRRQSINPYRKVFEFIQISSFFVGAGLMAIFAISNL